MRHLLSIILIVALIGCANKPVKNDTKDSPNICNDCEKDDFKNYTPCYAVVNGKRNCDLCDAACCEIAPGKRDRCCCLHAGRRDDCFKVCITKKLEKGLHVSEENKLKYKNWKEANKYK
jgi:hypothetical protein